MFDILFIIQDRSLIEHILNDWLSHLNKIDLLAKATIKCFKQKQTLIKNDTLNVFFFFFNGSSRIYVNLDFCRGYNAPDYRTHWCVTHRWYWRYIDRWTCCVLNWPRISNRPAAHALAVDIILWWFWLTLRWDRLDSHLDHDFAWISTMFFVATKYRYTYR